MSAYFSTASTSNYLQYDAGSDSDFSYPFTIACWMKHGAITAAQSSLTFADYNAGSASNRYTTLCAGYTSGTRRYVMEHRSETYQSYESASGVNPPTDTWYAMVLVCTNATTRTLYWGTSSSAYTSSNDDTGDAGSSLSIRYATIGAQWRAAASISRPWSGYVARAARWTTGLTAGEIESYLDGTEPTSIQAGSLWGYWKLDGASLADSSGSSPARDLVKTGSVGDSTDEPFAAANLFVKLLAHSSAASATAVEGVVLNSTRDTLIGEFTGQAFEAALEGSPGEAVLLIDVADISPNGATLTTSDAPIVFAYNSTDGTVGEGIASVIEV